MSASVNVGAGVNHRVNHGIAKGLRNRVGWCDVGGGECGGSGESGHLVKASPRARRAGALVVLTCHSEGKDGDELTPHHFACGLNEQRCPSLDQPGAGGANYLGTGLRERKGKKGKETVHALIREVAWTACLSLFGTVCQNCLSV